MEEEGGDDPARDAGHHVAELDGADVVEEGGRPAAVTHHGAGLDLSVAQWVLYHDLVIEFVTTETKC